MKGEPKEMQIRNKRRKKDHERKTRKGKIGRKGERRMEEKGREELEGCRQPPRGCRGKNNQKLSERSETRT